MPNYGEPGRGPRLAEGMVLAIEPMVNAGQAGGEGAGGRLDGGDARRQPVGALRAHGGGDGGRAVDSDGAGSARSTRVRRDASGRRSIGAAAERAVPGDGWTRGTQVTAHIADRIDRNFVRVLVGDRVRVELSPVDVGRGRIVRTAVGRRCSRRACRRFEDTHEGPSVGQADLRQVQDRPPPRRGAGDLLEPEAQADGRDKDVWHVLQASISRGPSASRSVSPTSTASGGCARTRSSRTPGVSPDIRVKDLSEDDVRKISRVIEEQGGVEGDLRKEISMNIKRLMEIGCYRGLRHRRGLPVRGQRTQTNARTRKGPRKGAIAKKKVDLDMAKSEAVDATPAARDRRRRKAPASARRRSRSAARSASSTTAWRTSRRRSTTPTVTITDTEGNVVAWSSAGGIGFKGSRKGTPFAATQAALERRQRRQDRRHALARRAGQGPGLRPRVGDPRAADGRPRGEVDPRRHADSAQRLPAAEAATRLRREVIEWRVISDPSAVCAAARR